MSDTKASAASEGLALFEKCYNNFVREHEAAQHELTKRILTAQHEYRMSQTDRDSSADPSVAADGYAEAVRRAWRESQKAAREAHDNFIGNLADAWKRSNRADLEPGGLVAVANALAAVAHQTAASVGNLDVFAATGVTPPTDAFSAIVEDSGGAAKKATHA